MNGEINMSMKPPIGQNVTDIITKLNHERMLFQLPVMMCLVVIMVVSLLGNSLVVCVYKSKYKKRTSSYFIVVLAIVDLCSALCIPFVVFDLANPFKHAVPVMCKINRFIEALTSTASGMILVCIAFDRFFHVCYPLRIYSIHQAQSLTIVMLSLSASLTWPMLFLGGKRTVVTPVPGVFGEDCSYKDGMINSIYTLLFQSGLFFAFFMTFSISFVFYARIFYVIYKRRNTMIGEQCYSIKDESSNTESTRNSEHGLRNHSNDTTDTNGNVEMKEITESGHHVEDGVGNTNNVLTDDVHQANSKSLPASQTEITKMSKKMPKVSRRGEKRTSRGSKTQIKTTRTTIILAMVTLAALVGFLPYLAVSLMINFGIYFQPGMPLGEDLAYEFCSKSYFLNGALNPVIYSVMNPVFRAESVAILKKFANVFHRK